MAEHAVTFESSDRPQLVANPDPVNCFAFAWDIIFSVTQGSGLKPGRSSKTGHIIQQVTIRKFVFTCANQLDPTSSDYRSIVESFELKKGETNADAVQIGFPINRRTTASIRLEAAWRADLNGLAVLKTFANPGQNISGASALLGAPPASFNPTLTRTIDVTVDCCGQTPFWTMVVRAYNRFGTYSEEFHQTFDQKKGEVTKRVDGMLVEVE